MKLGCCLCGRRQPSSEELLGEKESNTPVAPRKHQRTTSRSWCGCCVSGVFRVLATAICLMVYHLTQMTIYLPAMTQENCMPNMDMVIPDVRPKTDPAEPNNNLIIKHTVHKKLDETNSTSQYAAALQVLADETIRAQVDPVAQVYNANATQVDFYPQVEYLGILIDAGRHYFPIDWLKQLIVYLHRLRFNMIHLRLTDDQAVNLRCIILNLRRWR